MKNSWIQYFLDMAELVSTRSRDTATKVGCVIVNPESKAVLSTGYNDFPMGVDDSISDRRLRPAKYLWTEHAERNAIYLAARHGTSLDGAWLFLNYSPYPCMDCSRAIAQAGITCVVGAHRPWDGKLDCKHDEVNQMFDEIGIERITMEIA